MQSESTAPSRPEDHGQWSSAASPLSRHDVSFVDLGDWTPTRGIPAHPYPHPPPPLRSGNNSDFSLAAVNINTSPRKAGADAGGGQRACVCAELRDVSLSLHQ